MKSNDPDQDTMTILYIGDERIFHQDYYGMEATYWIFLPLVRNVGDERGEIIPVLAESWSHSDDYRTWTVKLREDIFWHDGVKMTAEDVKFSIDLKNSEAFQKIECELIDEFTFTITTEKPKTSLPTWEVYYPKHLLEHLDPKEYYSWDFWSNPVGNGPYKFVRSMPKTMVEVTVNPLYFGEKPKIKNARLKFSQNASLQELLSGNVDALTYVKREMLIKIKGDDRFNSYHWWGGWLESLIWNHNNPLFEETKVRQALTQGVNRVELAEVLFYPEGVPITEVMSTRRQRLKNDLPPGLPYDPNEATKLLNECGWYDTNNNGILDRDGVEFQFEVIVNEQNKLMATYIQNNYKEIGISMKIQTIENNIIRERFREKAFDVILTRFDNSFNFRWIREYFGEDSKIGYQNKEMDSIINLIENTGNIEEIDRLAKELHPIFQKDLPITFILPQVQTHIVRSNVKGLNNLYRTDPVWFLEYLWFE